MILPSKLMEVLWESLDLRLPVSRQRFRRYANRARGRKAVIGDLYEYMHQGKVKGDEHVLLEG